MLCYLQGIFYKDLIMEYEQFERNLIICEIYIILKVFLKFKRFQD